MINCIYPQMNNPFMGNMYGLNNFYPGNYPVSVFGGYQPLYNPFMFMSNAFMFPYMPMLNIFQGVYDTTSRIFDKINKLIENKQPETNKPNNKDNVSEKTAQNTEVLAVKHAGKTLKARGQALGTEFLNGVKRVAQNINCDYRDLLAIMNAESGLNPHAVNPKGGATGLIQFMPKTAQRLGTTTEALKNMSAIEQLPYVEEFLRRCKKAAGFAEGEKLSSGDLYALVFLPARAKREILCEKGEGNRYYECNAATDLNKDGKITKSELSQRIISKRIDESIFA